MPSKEAATWGAKAERAAARKYGLERESESWYDAYYKSNGRKVQVKSCDTARENPRFRFWKEEFDKIREARGSYVLVTYSSETGNIAKIWKVMPSKLGRVASWGPAEHAEKSGKQAKINWRQLV